MGIQETVNIIYNDKLNQGFFAQYGIDLIIALTIIYLFSVASMYFYVLNNIPELQKKWPKEKCNPLYLPFASLVNRDSNESHLDQIQDNFQGCIQNILTSIVSEALRPIYYVTNVATSTMQEAVNATQSIRGLFDRMRNDIGDIAQNISGRTLNVTLPFVQQLSSMRDVMGKTQGIFTSLIFTLLGSYLTLRSLIGAIIEIILIVILVALTASIIGVMFIPFIGWALAAPLIAIFIAITVPLAIIIIVFNNVFHGSFSGPPSPPG